MLEKYVEELKPYINELFGKDSSGHDLTHLTRTMELALYIQSKEGGDRLIVGLSALLHDVHRIMQTELGRFVSPKESLPKVREILSHVDLSDDEINQICYAIEHHEEYNWNGNNVSDINALILQDADNLEAIGAIGIGRAFVYGGAHNIIMYNENIPFNTKSDFLEENGDNESTLHHFYHKLFKLADNMNTKTGRKIAKKRIKFMKKFTNEFLEEWNFKA